jgi:hypothetical protein
VGVCRPTRSVLKLAETDEEQDCSSYVKERAALE